MILAVFIIALTSWAITKFQGRIILLGTSANSTFMSCQQLSLSYFFLILAFSLSVSRCNSRLTLHRKIEKNEIKGGYCDYSCKYYCEEFIDSDGEIGFDFTGAEIVDHYCTLGHSSVYGRFCKYYEKYDKQI